MISEEDAAGLVGALVATTTGWNDDSVDATMVLIQQRWRDIDVATEAVNGIVNTWTRPSRPSWGTLAEAYLNAQRRRAMSVPAITPGSDGLPLTIEQGRAVAARSYAAECRRRNPETDPHIRSGYRTNEPSQRVLDSLLGLIGADDAGSG